MRASAHAPAARHRHKEPDRRKPPTTNGAQQDGRTRAARSRSTPKRFRGVYRHAAPCRSSFPNARNRVSERGFTQIPDATGRPSLHSRGTGGPYAPYQSVFVRSRPMGRLNTIISTACTRANSPMNTPRYAGQMHKSTPSTTSMTPDAPTSTPMPAPTA